MACHHHPSSSRSVGWLAAHELTVPEGRVKGRRYHPVSVEGGSVSVCAVHPRVPGALLRNTRVSHVATGSSGIDGRSPGVCHGLDTVALAVRDAVPGSVLATGVCRPDVVAGGGRNDKHEGVFRG
jgi:hypothetical protein